MPFHYVVSDVLLLWELKLWKLLLQFGLELLQQWFFEDGGAVD